MIGNKLSKIHQQLENIMSGFSPRSSKAMTFASKEKEDKMLDTQNNMNKTSNINNIDNFEKSFENRKETSPPLDKSFELEHGQKRKSEQFIAPSFTKQQTADSGTFGMGTPTGRSVITPNYTTYGSTYTPTWHTTTSHNSVTNYNKSKSRRSRMSPAAARIEEEKDGSPPSGSAPLNESNESEFQSQSQSPTPITLEEAIEAAIEKKQKYHDKREMYSGKAQYETPLDLNGMLEYNINLKNICLFDLFD